MKHITKNWIKAVLLVLGTTLWVLAQENTLTQADRLYDTRNYAKAVALYEQALNEPQLNVAQRRQCKTNMAYAYFQLGDSPKSEKLYEEVLAEAPFKGFMIAHYLHFAKVLGNNSKGVKAQEVFAIYEAAKREDNKGGGIPRTNTNKKISYRLDNLAFNTENAEFSPAYYRDGLVYLAGSSSVSDEKVQKGYLDIFYIANHMGIGTVGGAVTASNRTTSAADKPAYKLGSDAYTRITSNDSRTMGTYRPYGADEGAAYSGGVVAKPGKPVSFSKTLNTKYHEGPVTFSKDGTKIIFTRNNFNDGKKGQSSESDIKLKLYSAQKGNQDWENIQELPFNSDEYSTAHPAFSADGTKLYFVSDMPGGMGGKDLYVSRLENGQWTTPINLGKEINTKADEVFPFSDDNGNLYFSTSGRRGLGGLDIFYAVISADGTRVIDVLPLDAPLNSKGDDFGIVTDGSRSVGYLSSNREDGNDNIYRFTRESSLYDCRFLTLRVLDNETMQPIDSARIAVRSRGGSETNQEMTTDEYGRAHLCLASDNDFVFTVSKEGLLSSTVGFSTRGLTDDKPSRFEMTLNHPTAIEYAEPVAEQQPPSPETSTNDTEFATRESATTSAKNASKNKQKMVNSFNGLISKPLSDQPIRNTLIQLINDCTGKVAKTTYSDNRGYYEFKNVSIDGCSYSVKPNELEGMVMRRTVKPTPKSKVVTTDFSLFKEGETMGLDKVKFNGSKTTLSPEAARELERIVTMMRKYPTIKAEILSHTDSRGETDQNKAVSQKRAQAIVDHLVKKGIVRTRLKAVGMGESQPLNECVDGVKCTDPEYERNRRTEFKITSVN